MGEEKLLKTLVEEADTLIKKARIYKKAGNDEEARKLAKQYVIEEISNYERGGLDLYFWDALEADQEFVLMLDEVHKLAENVFTKEISSLSEEIKSAKKVDESMDYSSKNYINGLIKNIECLQTDYLPAREDLKQTYILPVFDLCIIEPPSLLTLEENLIGVAVEIKKRLDLSTDQVRGSVENSVRLLSKYILTNNLSVEKTIDYLENNRDDQSKRILRMVADILQGCGMEYKEYALAAFKLEMISSCCSLSDAIKKYALSREEVLGIAKEVIPIMATRAAKNKIDGLIEILGEEHRDLFKKANIYIYLAPKEE